MQPIATTKANPKLLRANVLVRSHVSLTNESGRTSFGTWSRNFICDSRNWVSSPFSLLLANRVVWNESWRVASRELAVVHCESWPACFILFFLLLPHETAQTKYRLYRKSFGDELKLHLEYVHAHYYFFFAHYAEKYMWCSVFLFAPKLASLGKLRYTVWHCTCVTDTIARTHSSQRLCRVHLHGAIERMSLIVSVKESLTHFCCHWAT